MNPRPQRVAVVLDPEFGDKLMELATSVHVWAVDSQANKAAADRYVRGLKDRKPDIDGIPVEDPGETRSYHCCGPGGLY